MNGPQQHSGWAPLSRQATSGPTSIKDLSIGSTGDHGEQRVSTNDQWDASGPQRLASKQHNIFDASATYLSSYLLFFANHSLKFDDFLIPPTHTVDYTKGPLCSHICTQTSPSFLFVLHMFFSFSNCIGRFSLWFILCKSIGQSSLNSIDKSKEFGDWSENMEQMALTGVNCEEPANLSSSASSSSWRTRQLSWLRGKNQLGVYRGRGLVDFWIWHPFVYRQIRNTRNSLFLSLSSQICHNKSINLSRDTFAIY